MTMVTSRAGSGVARYLIPAVLFAASVSGMLLRPMKSPPAPRHSAIAGTAAMPVAISTSPTNRIALARDYGNLPLRFEVNRGQTAAQAKFISRGSDSTLFLTASDAVLVLEKPSSSPSPYGTQPALATSPHQHSRSAVAVRMTLAGTSPNVEPQGLDPLPGASNYFIGNDPSRWRTNVPNFAKVKYAAIYPGVDLLYYGHHHDLEYDFIVAAHADPSQIRLKIDGADFLAIASNGDLVMATPAGEIRLNRPAIFQKLADRRASVQGGYFLASSNEVGLRVGAYDPGRELVIDPVLVYSTFLGGTTSDSANAIAIDPQDNAYLTGETSSIDFPTTTGVLQSSLHGTKNAFVTKLNPAGTALLYSTYLGGPGNGDAGFAIAFDSAGDAYVTGQTTSSTFPAVNAFQSTLKSTAGDAFVAELNPTGTALLFSTYLGGSGAAGDLATGIAVDSTGAAYVTGQTSSIDFPVQTPIQKSLINAVSAAFVTKFSAGGTPLVYSTYLGGSGSLGDSGAAITLDSSEDAYVVGATSSSDFLTTTGAFQTALKGTGHNAFLTELNPSGSAFAYSTFLGGSTANGGLAFGLALDSTNAAYITGLTSASDFPITANSYQKTLKGSGGYAFVSKINPAGQGSADLVYSTFLGGSGTAAVADEGLAIGVDSGGNVNVAGSATSPDFPTTVGAFQTTLNNPAGNAFLSRLDPTGASLLYSSYLGGSKGIGDAALGLSLDSSGTAYLAGRAGDSDFPTTSGVIRPTFTAPAGGTNGFVSKLAANAVVSIVPVSVTFGNQLLNLTAPAQIVSITNNSSATLTFTVPPALSGSNVNEFASATTCGLTLAPNTGCDVTLSFTPTVLGAASAALTFTDDDPGSPQVIPISGTGYLDFTITGPGSETVSDGNDVTFTIEVTPIDGSTQTVNLTCAGAPTLSTCVLAPTSLTLDGTDVADSTGTITASGYLLPSHHRRTPIGLGGPAGFLALGFLLMIALAFARRRSLRLGFGAAALACLVLAGCGGGPSTPQGVSTVVITGVATPGGQTHTVDITLTVN
ncbi:MAG: SBBP repeat-containing protein [Candidatus Acidiferrales bacterium]